MLPDSNNHGSRKELKSDITVTNLRTACRILSIAALICLSVASHAQRSSELSADLPITSTLAVQDKVEKLFDAGHYERAYFIYRNELSPLGDKYAQYMVGFMYQSGLGVDEDAISAGAWYQLSAERGTREFVAVRDRYLQTMDEEDVARSRALHKELRLKYCDLAVLLSSIKRDVRELRNISGSRLGGQVSPMVTIRNRSNQFVSGSDYYGSIREDVERRLTLLKEVGDFEDIDVDADRLNIGALEERVLQHIETEIEVE